MNHTPDFDQFATVLRRGRPDRPVLFEYYLNGRLYERLAGRPAPTAPQTGGGRSVTGRVDESMSTEYRAYVADLIRWYADAWRAGGYDYVTLMPGIICPAYSFRKTAHTKARSHSINEGGLITDRESLERFDWPDADAIDPAALDTAAGALPDGMRFLICGPMGVLENMVDLVGYDNLCYMLVDDRELVRDIADAFGSRLLEWYERLIGHASVGTLIANDDWGFKTQTMIAPDDLREFVFPWYRKFAALAHEHDKPALLHSCGRLDEVMDDVIDDLRLDGKHSYEDVILPVEDAYERWGHRIAIIGGIDVDFLCTATPDEITRRARAMLDRTSDRGGYALGSGNSIPDYVPDDAFFAMTKAALS